MKLKIVEPLRMLFKDEVRRVGASLGIDPELLEGTFPGPGLSIRFWVISHQKVSILQDVDAVFIGLKSWGCTIKYGKLEHSSSCK
jgi:GMP synthase (glutamine-hydrolysing)